MTMDNCTLLEALDCYGNWSDCMRTMKEAKAAIIDLEADNARLREALAAWTPRAPAGRP